MTWDPFQQPAAPAAVRQRHEAQTELARLARATFHTVPGAAFLARLRAEVMEPPSYNPGEPFDMVAWREGQKALLRRIESLLKED